MEAGMIRLLVFLCLCSTTVAAESTSTTDTGTATCVVGDVRPECLAPEEEEISADAFPMSLIWPPSCKTFPNLALITICAWVVVGRAMMNKESNAEIEYQRKRARQIFSDLAQTQYEHQESAKKWAAYNNRKDSLTNLAAERLAKLKKENPNICVTQEEVFSTLAVETGFAGEDPPEAALRRLRRASRKDLRLC